MLKAHRSIFNVFAGAVLLAGCAQTAEGSDPTLFITGTESLPLSNAASCPSGKELICHKPRGQALTLCVARAAVAAHRRHHGDESGACASGGDAGAPDLCDLVRSGLFGGAGAACAVSAECFSGMCVRGNCQAGAEGSPCENGGDCISGACEARCACAPGEPQGAGGPCTVGNQCLSGVCVAAVCAPSNAGEPCRVATDCQPPLICTAGVCQ